MRKVVVGTDPVTGQVGPDRLPLQSIFTAVVTLRNTAGGTVPAGRVDVKAVLVDEVAWDANPTFQGSARVFVPLTVTSVKAGW